MGVPKFYRWMSERYPCLSEVVKEYQIPEFDNLYLDMNGVVHVCSHPEDDNPHFRITEEKIFQDIFHYIEVLFRMIKPRKVFFMAIDGVAPRAKMNQQRGRRFRSAREAEDLVRKALEKGEILPKESRFDSNCITPGTPFMVRLHEQIKYFMVNKLTNDRLWQGVRIYLSGHETPGEGEHKIMDFIRFEKSKPGYDPNTRHCLYGLDADLIMLGLVSHEPHFSLLREEVRFGGKNSQKRSTAPEETTFHLLHLSLMREYLNFEFGELQHTLPFAYNLENIIDDWVLMGFLVGNDFIPHLPNLHIHSDCLPKIWRVYKQVLPTLDGYLNEEGTLNLPRLERFLRVLAKLDLGHFSEQIGDQKWLQGKKRPPPKRNAALGSKRTGIPTANEFLALQEDSRPEPAFQIDEVQLKEDLSHLPLDEFSDLTVYELVDEEEEDDEYRGESYYTMFREFKAKYYMEKLEYRRVTGAVLQEQAECYVRALQWNLFYYYNGVPSWSWYYPHHYAPFLSDVKDFRDMDLTMDLSTPFLPFQQLMAVLPAASKNLLPVPLQELMINQQSPVIDFYPVNFKTDLNGKRQDWEAVVLIPFIEENRLLRAMAAQEPKMTEEERKRNSHGPHILGEYHPEPQSTYPSSLKGAFPDITHHHAVLTELNKFYFVVPSSDLKRGLCAGVKLDVYFPGFPTLHHIPHKAELKACGVKVFQMSSKSENMMLQIQASSSPPDIEEVANEYLGQSVFVAWPHLQEARVVAVTNLSAKLSVSEGTAYKTRTHGRSGRVDIVQEDADGSFGRREETLREVYYSRRGVEVGDTDLIIYACPMTGRKYVCGNHGNITLEKQWSSVAVPYLFQTCVKDIAVKDETFIQYKTLDDLYAVGSQAFMLGQPHYGCMGEVLSVDAAAGRVRVDVSVHAEPDFQRTRERTERYGHNYIPGYQVARRLGIDGYTVSRITGTIFVQVENKGQRASRINIALNLKFNKTQKEVPGFTKKVNETEWLYSQKVIGVLQNYIHEFPDVFEFISTNNSENSYDLDHIFPDDASRFKELQDFLKKQDCYGIEPVPHGTQIVEEQYVTEIEQEVDRIKAVTLNRKHVKMQVRPHLLFRPLDAQQALLPDPSSHYELFDRIINIRDSYSVPIGLRGTVIGICAAEKEQDVLYEVVFDEPFMGGLKLRCSENRGYRMPAMSIINITHGERKANGGSAKPMAVVKPQKSHQQQQRHQPQNQPQYQQQQQQHQQQHHQHQQQYQQQQHQQQQHQQQPRSSNNSNNNRPTVVPQQGDRRMGRGEQGRGDTGRGDTGRGEMRQGESSRGQQRQQQPQPLSTMEFINQSLAEHDQRTKSQMQPPPDKDTGDFAMFWTQLQKGEVPMTTRPVSASVAKQPVPHSVQPPNARSQKWMEAQRADGFDGPSLQEAARALQASSQHPPPHGNQGNNSKSPRSKEVVSTGISEDDEFVKMLKTLQESNKQKEARNQQQQQPKQQHPQKSKQQQAQRPLRIVADDKAQEALSADIKNILKITPADAMNVEQIEGQTQPHSDGNKGQAEVTAKPTYGKQVSLQELFQGAGQASNASLVVEPSQPAQSPATKRTAVASLSALCQTLGLMPPQYTYQGGRDGTLRAVVNLSNGAAMQGSYARSRARAVESAAGVALLQLQPQQPLMLPSGGPPHSPSEGALLASPTSAFTPVRPPQGEGPPGPPGPRPFMGMGPPPPGFPHPHMMPPRGYGPPPPGPHIRHPRHPQRPPPPHPGGYPHHGMEPWQPWPGHHGNQPPPGLQGQGHIHGQRPPGGAFDVDVTSPQKNKGAETESKTPVKNPFIPLQVQRHQITPQKDGTPSKSPSQSSGEVPPSTVTATPTDVPQTKPNSGPREHQGSARSSNPDAKVALKFDDNKPALLETPETVKKTPSKQTPRSGDQGRGSKSTPRRPKSRIAANFGTPS